MWASLVTAWMQVAGAGCLTRLGHPCESGQGAGKAGLGSSLGIAVGGHCQQLQSRPPQLIANEVESIHGQEVRAWLEAWMLLCPAAAFRVG